VANLDEPCLVRPDAHFSRDEEGIDLDSLELAQAEAVFSLLEAARDALPGKLQQKLTVKVRDDKGMSCPRPSLLLR
jgi:hypothetical protein